MVAYRSVGSMINQTMRLPTTDSGLEDYLAEDAGGCWASQRFAEFFIHEALSW